MNNTELHKEEIQQYKELRALKQKIFKLQAEYDKKAFLHKLLEDELSKRRESEKHLRQFQEQTMSDKVIGVASIEPEQYLNPTVISKEFQDKVQELQNQLTNKGRGQV